MATGYQIEDGKVKKLRSDFTPAEWGLARLGELTGHLERDCQIMDARLDEINRLMKRQARIMAIEGSETTK